jgi:hypothetical protein
MRDCAPEQRPKAEAEHQGTRPGAERGGPIIRTATVTRRFSEWPVSMMIGA